MGSTINATTGVNGGGVVVTADNTGIISLQSNGQTFVTSDSNGNTTVGSAGSLQLKTNSTVNAVLLANGNFGIGNTSPVNALDVNGNITSGGNYLSPFNGFKNRLINGNMRFWQRGTTFTNINSYSADRWYTNRAGGVSNNSFSQISANPDNKQYMRIQRTSGDANTSSFNIYQAIEQHITADMIGQQVTFSCKIAPGSNAVGTTINLNLNYSIANTTDYGPNTGTWNSLNGNTLTISNWGWTSNASPPIYQQTFTVPQNATQLQTVLQWNVSGTANTSYFIDVTDIQLELGNTATHFERRPDSIELEMCQRYYQVLTGHRCAGASVASSAGNYCYWHFSTGMRVIPSLSFSGSGYDSIDSYGIDGICVYKGGGPVAVIGTGTSASAEL